MWYYREINIKLEVIQIIMFPIMRCQDSLPPKSWYVIVSTRVDSSYNGFSNMSSSVFIYTNMFV